MNQIAWKKIQNEAARIVTGATKLTSLQSLYIETGWESLASRRQKSKLVLFYKMQNEMTPEYLSSLAPPTVGSTTRYRLRNESDLQTIPAKSQQCYHSFLPSVTRAWNRLPEETKTSPSITAFKHKLNKDIKKPPQYYYCGKRLGQVHHTRLRLNCSSLHQNLFSKNIINDPYCECGEIEDTEHYLLNCNLYQNLREELLNTVTTYCQPTLNVLLYGNANLSDSENKTIFSAVQEFILKTKRF